MSKNNYLGWILLIALSFSPALLLFVFGPGNYFSITHTLGQLAGLIGMTMFALTFLLACRFRFIENLFGGLDKVYMVHGVLGGTSLILLLFHPILLVLKFLPGDFHKAAIYILPSSYWSTNFGIIALLGMIILIFITLYSKMKYHRWKISHEFLGAIFIIAIFHVFMVRTQAARDYIFAGYYIYAAIVSIIGLVSFIYILAIRGKTGNSADYFVESIRQRDNVFEVSLKPVKDPIKYQSGQFVFLKFHSKGMIKEQHPFSIASKSNDPRLKIGIKVLGDFTVELNKVKQGDKVTVEGPYGRFYESHSSKDKVWIAGGIGITPFFGMAEDLLYNNTSNNTQNYNPKKVDLFYSVKTESEFVGLNNLRLIEQHSKGKLTVHPWITQKQGYIDLAQIKKKIGNITDKEFYICGPASLKESITESLLKLGISKSMIHDERFNFK